MQDTKLKKEHLRKQMKKLIAGYKKEELNNFSTKICQKLEKKINQKKIRKLGVFAPQATEPNIWPLLHYLAFPVDNACHPCESENQSLFSPRTEMTIQIFFPRIHDQMLEFIEITSKTQLEKGVYDILQPKTDLSPADPMKLDAVLIPGLAFDHNGNRLGRGKGFYDRLIKNLPLTVSTWGVCFPFQILQFIPAEDADQPVSELFS